MSRGYIVGVDLGQAKDYTALGIVEIVPLPPTKEIVVTEERVGGGWSHPGVLVRQEREVTRDNGNHYHLRHLERLPLGTSYAGVVEHVKGLMGREPLKGAANLVVDATGVGRPVVDFMRRSGLRPIGVTLTGGISVSSAAGGGYNVPKRDVVSALQVVYQSSAFKVAAGLALAPTMVEEMLNFKMTLTPEGHDQYAAWREREHDDIVLAVGVAVWYASTRKRWCVVL